MLEYNVFKNLFTKTLLTAAWLILALSFPALSAQSFCGESLRSTHTGSIEYTIRKTEDNPETAIVKFESFVPGREKSVGQLEVRKLAFDRIHISQLEVEQPFRENGIAEALIKRMILENDPQTIYSSLLAETNRVVFQDKYNEISNPRSRNFLPGRSMEQRQLIALEATPAYKIRKALGISKIVKFEATNCNNISCVSSDISLYVTKPDP